MAGKEVTIGIYQCDLRVPNNGLNDLGFRVQLPLDRTPLRVLVIAATRFRAGTYDAARELLLKITQRDENPDAKMNASPAYGWYFLAMTQQALGNTEEAKTLLAKVNQWTASLLSDEENPPAWNRRLTLDLLRDEAKQAITYAVENQPIGDAATSEKK